MSKYFAHIKPIIIYNKLNPSKTAEKKPVLLPGSYRERVDHYNKHLARRKEKIDLLNNNENIKNPEGFGKDFFSGIKIDS